MIAVIPVVLPQPETDWSDYRDLPTSRCEFSCGRKFIEKNGVRLLWMFVLALYVLNFGYGFERLGSLPFISRSLSGEAQAPASGANRFANSWIGQIPLPVPANYVHRDRCPETGLRERIPLVSARRVEIRRVVVLLRLCVAHQGTARGVVPDAAGRGDGVAPVDWFRSPHPHRHR